MSHLRELPMRTAAARPGFVAETQPATARSQLLYQLPGVTEAVRHSSSMPDLPAVFPIATAIEIVAL